MGEQNLINYLKHKQIKKTQIIQWLTKIYKCHRTTAYRWYNKNKQSNIQDTTRTFFKELKKRNKKKE